MRAVVLRSLAVVGVGALILAGVLYVASTVDARPPEVLSIVVTQPIADDPDRAHITTSLEVAFSEPVEEDAAAAALRVEPAVDGAVSWSGSTMIFTPAEPLALETAYTVSVTGGIRDLAGNEMAELPPAFRFQTAGRPTVVETLPADDATEVPLDATIQIAFSTLMDTASVEAALAVDPPFAHELRWSEERLEIVPAMPLGAERDYAVTIDASAADVAGVTLAAAYTFDFRTVAPGLEVETLVPADAASGISPATPIAVIFDRPIDPATVADELLAVEPAVAGTLEIVAPSGEELEDDGAGRILAFRPSGPLPPNTTFDVELAAGITSTGGGGLAEPLRWTFTTGAPTTTLSNQITYLSDRGGIANVWAMNPDGTGQRQVTAELATVTDYAVAPDGSSLVVGDGRRLIVSRPDGSERRELTPDGAWDFDPAYSPNGQQLAFARADAISGAGLGLWLWEVGGGEPARIELPAEIRGEPTPSPGPSPAGVDVLLRAPRFSPDGHALAFVDASGVIGMLELPAERLTRVEFSAVAPPTWMPDSSAVVLTGTPRIGGASDDASVAAPVEPLAGDGPLYRLARSGLSPRETDFVGRWRILAIAADGTIASVGTRGLLATTADLDTVPSPDPRIGERIAAAAFAPGEAAMVVVLGAVGEPGPLARLDLDTGRLTELEASGSRPRWQP